MKILEGMQIYYQKCKAENLSQKTIRNYGDLLMSFYKYVKKYDIDNIEEVKPHDIINYMEYSLSRYSDITAKNRYTAVKAFYNFLIKEEYISFSPVSKIKKPKVGKKIIYSFTDEEVKEILSHYDTNDFIALRNHMIMVILFSTGVRISELLTISIYDIDLNENFILITGKGNKQRMIPISNLLNKKLVTYLRRRQEYVKTTKYNSYNLIINKDGGALTKSGINTIFRKLKASKKKWSTRVSPHTFRHTFAKKFLMNGGNLFSLQKILGHEDISITRIYVDLDDTDILNQNNRYNPLDNLRHV